MLLAIDNIIDIINYIYKINYDKEIFEYFEEYKYLDNNREEEIENYFVLDSNTNYDKLINYLEKFNLHTYFTLKLTYDLGEANELINKGFNVRNIRLTIENKLTFNVLEQYKFLEDENNYLVLELFIDMYREVNIPKYFNKLKGIKEIKIKGDGCINILDDNNNCNLPDTIEKIYFNFNSVDIHFTRTYYSLQCSISRNYHNFDILDEPIYEIREIDYNILSPNKNLKYIYIPDIIIHYNKLINIPEDVKIKQFSYQNEIYDYWTTLIEHDQRYDY